MYDEPKPAAAGCFAQAEADTSTGMPDWVRRCRRIAGEIGAEEFSLLLLASNADGTRLVPVFDAGFPGIADLSRKLSTRAAEGFARAATASSIPIWWSGSANNSSLQGLRWARETASADFDAPGLALPLFEETGRCGLFACSGPNIELDDRILCDVHLRCLAVFAEVVKLRMTELSRFPVISKRELECLKLTANGLTSDAIASTLGLSVHTANQYLTNTTQKLNAVNRIHAVAKALRSGLID
ncbi:helix-turn-helix transcriptional regulator [Aquamicrobium sp. LC103]|uniref:helix-turn-helix transcriptional regulator n=1 Tax=Aquamicrobium sp. LC103 TaxID=1120658 RepID=UPI00063E8D0A|nr:helix-turn-helix transcriptional regulator [Aquamicrobium sp. LC103]